jgi:hypothetical protein
MMKCQAMHQEQRIHDTGDIGKTRDSGEERGGEKDEGYQGRLRFQGWRTKHRHQGIIGKTDSEGIVKGQIHFAEEGRYIQEGLWSNAWRSFALINLRGDNVMHYRGPEHPESCSNLFSDLQGPGVGPRLVRLL